MITHSGAVAPDAPEAPTPETHDPFFAPANAITPVFTIDLSSPKSAESYLDIPLRPVD
ncbi:hypothetical protein [Kitasatospora sp. NPDC056184]|uniref:hypothetical protein n=1 Tax=Kitasatospora sp. NPDC056184 TaxID=3345738 RepID=UPI0035E3AAA0